MNNTITSFSLYNKYRTIPILATIPNQSSDNEYSNQLNQLESIKSTLYSNTYLQTDIAYEKKYKKQLNKKVIPSIKYISENKKKKFSNNINILKFNKDICSKTFSNKFTGKKIILSKYPNINLNKIEENEKKMKKLLYNDGKENKTIEINSTFFEKNSVFKNRNYINKEYFATKIEKELNDILNKTKINKIEINSD